VRDDGAICLTDFPVVMAEGLNSLDSDIAVRPDRATATGLAFVDTSVTPDRAYFAGQYRVGNTAYSCMAPGRRLGGD
jgi:hypothetical protein